MTYTIRGTEVFADVVEDENGTVTQVSFALNAPSPAHVEAAALVKNLMVAKQETQGGLLREWVEEVPHANFFPVAVELVPPVRNAQGEAITEPVMDTSYSVNLVLAGDLIRKVDEHGWFLWELLLLEWTGLGAETTVNDKVPGLAMSDVSLIDMSKVATPQGAVA
ncbi:hypothetical protein FEE96_06145 [Parasedimentitalea maritima]|uniref:DUF1842 domain-containing protein n=1 Tax=Parasedimentitalea maritima TaxID=2578117 RepID=A0ABY2UZX4_9RHOB|nr:hypothetical protein [Zongyanglinia marina]TLP68091.1 hypothetical protein FEE96_06145 [Zongyanglinia marina]